MVNGQIIGCNQCKNTIITERMCFYVGLHWTVEGSERVQLLLNYYPQHWTLGGYWTEIQMSCNWHHWAVSLKPYPRATAFT